MGPLSVSSFLCPPVVGFLVMERGGARPRSAKCALKRQGIHPITTAAQGWQTEREKRKKKKEVNPQMS